jgi:hypothetical protein
MVGPYLQKALIDEEKDTINFHAQEMGFFKRLLEKQQDEKLRQWFNFFISYSETKMELANERLEKLRNELIDYEQRQRELLAV